MNIMTTIQKKALHMYAENEPAMKRHEPVLNNLPGQLSTIEANDKILDNFHWYQFKRVKIKNRRAQEVYQNP